MKEQANLRAGEQSPASPEVETIPGTRVDPASPDTKPGDDDDPFSVPIPLVQPAPKARR